jgi:hypothetical protein
MIECPHCHRPITVPQISSFEDPPDSIEWVDVARVANLAEAGFLCDELVGAGIEARVHQQEEFNAAIDRWTSQYLIRVPIQSAQHAAVLVRQHLYEDGDGPQNRGFACLSTSGNCHGRWPWIETMMECSTRVNSSEHSARFELTNRILTWQFSALTSTT